MTSPRKLYAIVGMGQTGLSCAHYLAKKATPFFFVDTRAEPPNTEIIKKDFPHVPIYTGSTIADSLKNADTMIVSPGIPLDTPIIKQSLNAGTQLISDIDLFSQEIEAPIIGITGSNGKSTVTSLLGTMAQTAKMNAAVAGNIGIPVLDLLQQPMKDLYILELSSFQLERAKHLKPLIAVILNIFPDHLDVHHTFEAYIAAKQKIFTQCTYAVSNQEDQKTWPQYTDQPVLENNLYTFTSSTPKLGQFGIIEQNNQYYLARGKEILLGEDDIKLTGKHNLINAAAALTIGEILKFRLSDMLTAIKNFPGLAHRCQWIANRCGADWFNDSKGTNEASSITAINSLASKNKKNIVLIAGGDGKGADFHSFAQSIHQHVRTVILFGRDAAKIETAITGKTPILNAQTLEEAVFLAKEVVRKGERVLLSPACTSWDMFSSYEERGNRFIALVENL